MCEKKIYTLIIVSGCVLLLYVCVLVVNCVYEDTRVCGFVCLCSPYVSHCLVCFPEN